LHDYQLIPYDRSCELLSDVYGCKISPATLIRAENECFEDLEEFENSIKDALLQSSVIHSDETGYDGVVVHDFWKAYYRYLCDHGLCDAHLLRELIFISENYKQEWSEEMTDLLLVIKGCVDETRETSDSLTTEQIKDFETMYDYITKMGLEENPPPLDFDTKPKKRGRKKQTKPKNLLDRFVGYKGDIRSFCRIRGYISTVKKNNLPVIDAIGAVFNGKPFVPFMDRG
jgi:hypothetical protein